MASQQKQAARQRWARTSVEERRAAMRRAQEASVAKHRIGNALVDALAAAGLAVVPADESGSEGSPK